MAPRSERVQGFCPWCGQPLRPIVVHGEIRCGNCHMPVILCCEGAPLREHEVPVCPIPAEPPQPAPQQAGGGSKAAPEKAAPEPSPGGRPGEARGTAGPEAAQGGPKRRRRRS